MSPPALELAALPVEPIDALYVHIPFCAHKCHYCDFYSITRQTTDRMNAFVDRILTEAAMWADLAGGRLRPRTIFFGGGTPTLLPIEQMERLLHGLQARIDLSAVKEFTTEANPATVNDAYCHALRANGVNRLSFGAQSFDRSDLNLLERHHNPDDVPRSVEIARATGFERINIDLIYAIPGQTLESWHHTLDEALSLKLQHLSCYGLTYEPNTALTVRHRLGEFKAAPEPLEISMFHATRGRLQDAGLTAYEISNFATPGEACQHNLHYWNGGNYAALGPSGASHVGGVRFRNRPHLGEWESAIDRGGLAATDLERLSPEQRAGELIMLQLRLPDGVRFDEVRERFGIDVRTSYARELEQLSGGKLIDVDRDGFGLAPNGLILADAIAGEFVVTQ